MTTKTIRPIHCEITQAWNPCLGRRAPALRIINTRGVHKDDQNALDGVTLPEKSHDQLYELRSVNARRANRGARPIVIDGLDLTPETN